MVLSPLVLDAEFEAAIAYLVRRLDENTAPGSFLGALFALREGSAEWRRQCHAFRESVLLSGESQLSAVPSRIQDRLTETPIPVGETDTFHNVADTDFSLPANRQWATGILTKWKDLEVAPIPIQVGGELQSRSMTGHGRDPSRPGHEAYRFCQADQEAIEIALETAVQSQPEWEALGAGQRASILRGAAGVMAANRADTIGAMLLDAGKNITEADVEVSEAIDFANYYAKVMLGVGWDDGTVGRACGGVVVTPPWNFSFAIPAGGVLAALAAGNSVILKPARESVLVAWMLVQQLWEAGVPKTVLQFAPTVDGKTGKYLVSDSRVGAVILTGSIFTAKLFQEWRPELRLYAETSGKNSLVITAAADLDLAVKDLVRGAFGHAGQKCSATSLALVEREVYENPKFIQQLKDAAESLTVGGSWNASATGTPVIRNPDEFLEKGLDDLKPMTLRDIAEELDLHESTVSRVTANKLMETPRGIFDLKFFFSVGISAKEGDKSHSARAVKERIKNLVAGETNNLKSGRPKIFSDEALALALQNDGIDIARRTVAKYREAIGIPSSADRTRAARLLS